MQFAHKNLQFLPLPLLNFLHSIVIIRHIFPIIHMNSDTSPPKSTHKRHLRLLKNRLKAKIYRLRNKSRISRLESQIDQLSHQISSLKEASKIVELPRITEVLAIKDTLLEKMNAAVETQGSAGEVEIESLLKQASEMFSPTGWARVDLLRTAFQRTVAMIVPEPVLLCLALNEGRFQDMQKLMESSMSPEMYQLLLTWQRENNTQKQELIDTFSRFKSVSQSIWYHASRLYTMVHSHLRPLFTSKQLGRMMLWVNQNYSDLKTEQVLDYGHHSTEVLNDS